MDMGEGQASKSYRSLTPINLLYFAVKISVNVIIKSKHKFRA